MFLVNYAYSGWEDHQLHDHVTEAAHPIGLVYKSKKAALDHVKQTVEDEMASMYEDVTEWGGIHNWTLTELGDNSETWTGYGSGGDAIAAIVICKVEFADPS